MKKEKEEDIITVRKKKVIGRLDHIKTVKKPRSWGETSLGNLKVAVLNVRSYMKNRTFIECIMMEKKYDIIILTET